MAISRYSSAPLLGMGTRYGTSDVVSNVRSAMVNGLLKTTTIVVKEAQRLDALAGLYYGDGRYWWILAACSNVGWGLQVPPGTVIDVPDLSDVLRLV